MCHLEAVAVNHIMQSKDISIQAKQKIVRLQKQNKSWKYQEEIAGTLGAAKSTVWYIPRKQECTGELRNIERPGRPQRTSVEDDQRIFSMVKKTPSQHPAKRRTLSRRQTCLQSREDFTRANTEASPQAANKTRLDFDNKHLK